MSSHISIFCPFFPHPLLEEDLYVVSGWLKCNVDCANFTAQRGFGIGVCFHDSYRVFIQAHGVYFPCVWTVAEDEATDL
jgi:hypothetical protein